MSVLAVEHPRLTVVLVEDDDADAKAMRRALSGSTAAGTVLRAVDGVAALDLLRGAHGPMPDRFLVLTDINMPRMDGLEFIRTLRADPDLHRAVVFLLTSSDTVEDREAAWVRKTAKQLRSSLNSGCPTIAAGDNLIHITTH